MSQFISYAAIAANTRTLAAGSYIGTAVTDALIASQSFFMVKLIAKDEEGQHHFLPWMGYTLGGLIGSLFSIWITKKFGIHG